jgi:hypothetical protein
MPTFNESVDVDIEPHEYLENCTDRELKELYNSLVEDYDMEREQETEDVRSEGQRKFNRHLNTLKENWISISKEDAQIIEVLGKKYGAV